MPYIKQVDRTKFFEHIDQVCGILNNSEDSGYVKGEYIGFVISRTTKRYLENNVGLDSDFGASFFNESKKKTLATAADRIAALLDRADPMNGAGQLNYVLSSILWGFMGQCEGAAAVRYGTWVYLRGTLEKISYDIEANNTGGQREKTMAFRRHLIVKGVLSDIVSETYRRVIAPYEDTKIEEHGDLWCCGVINNGSPCQTQEPQT